jgi:cytochrome P450
VVNNPDLIATVLEDDEETYGPQQLDPATIDRLGGDSLPTLSGPTHRARRRLIERVLGGDGPSGGDTRIVASAERRAATWEDGRTVDLEPEMTDLTVDQITELVFGDDAPAMAEPVRRLYRLSRRVVPRTLLPWAGLLWRLPLPLTRRFDRARANYQQTVDDLIARRRRSGTGTDDLLDRLLSAVDEDGVQLTDDQVRDETWTYVAQGAPAYALTWTWWLIGRHRDVEARLHAELDDVVGDRPPTGEDIPRLPFTRAVALEALRLYPTSLGAVRTTLRPAHLGTAEIPKGSTVMVVYWTTHRDERWWKRPEEFEPERWLAGADVEQPYTYLPFGAGHHRCPARSLALQQLVLTEAALARAWRPRPARETLAVGVVPFVRPRGGMPAILERRRVEVPAVEQARA